MTIAVTGITGNMGQAVLDAIAPILGIDKLKLLAHNKKRMKKLFKKHKALLGKTEMITGGISDPYAVKKLVSGSDLVINMAAVIPPHSDQNPKAAVECNEIGTKLLAEEIESITENQPALIHISTVALYGSRAGAHPFARVGDPLLVSPLDVYSATKLRGEFRILESDIEKWAVLRQSAMLHPKMFADNIHDGLMFHTVFDSPLEWTTAHDSGLLIHNIVEKFIAGKLPDGFWKRCFNIAGGKANRQYGIQSFDDGFQYIGGKTKDFFKPWYSATRNFHGVWYLDGDELNDMFAFQTQTAAAYWQQFFADHALFKAGKIVPKALIRALIFKRLLRDKNAPSYWAKHNDEARIIAHFGSRENYEKLLDRSWDDIVLPNKLDIKNLSDNETPVYYGFDFSKPDRDITQADLESVAAAHGGRLVGTFDGDMYAKLEWITQDGERFSARPYTVLRAGHWYNPVYDRFVWDFDRLAKKDKIFASLWYDSHDEDENIVYTLDADFKAHAEKIRS